MVLLRIPLNIYSKIIVYVYIMEGGGDEQINDIMFMWSEEVKKNVKF